MTTSQGRISFGQDIRLLIDELFASTPSRRRAAAEVIAQLGKIEPNKARKAYPALIVALDDVSRSVRRAALEAIAAMPLRVEARPALQRVRDGDVSLENRLIADYLLRDLPIPQLAPEPDDFTSAVESDEAQVAAPSRTHEVAMVHEQSPSPCIGDQPPLPPVEDTFFAELLQAIFGSRQTLNDLLREVGYNEEEAVQLCGPYWNLLRGELGVTWRHYMEAHVPKRDADIVIRRAGLWEMPAPTLQFLAEELGISRERVRQLQVRVIRTLSSIRHKTALSNRLAHAASRAMGIPVPTKVAPASRSVTDPVKFKRSPRQPTIEAASTRERAPSTTATPQASPQQGRSFPYLSDYLESCLLETCQMVGKGLSPTAIAQARGVEEKTVYKHLAILIGRRQVRVDDVLPREIIDVVSQALGTRRPFPSLAVVQGRVPAEISLVQIRCVVAALDAPLSTSPAASSARTATPHSKGVRRKLRKRSP